MTATVGDATDGKLSLRFERDRNSFFEIGGASGGVAATSQTCGRTQPPTVCVVAAYIDARDREQRHIQAVQETVTAAQEETPW